MATDETGPTATDDLLASADVWEMTLPMLPFYWEVAPKVLERYRRAGYTFVSATLQDWPPTFDGTVDCIARFKQLMEPHGEWLTFADSVAEIERGRRDGKLVIGINSQETRPLGEDLARVEQLRAHGVRHMLLAYNVRNLVADGCAEAADAGLSNFGRAVVREMERVGIVVDCAHTGRRSSLEALELCERPAIFSHAGAHAVHPHIRNADDDQIRMCAEGGGVIGVVGLGAFLGDPDARTSTVFEHVDHIASLVGAEHVGIGTDFVPFYPVKDHLAVWESYTAWPDPMIAWPQSDAGVASSFGAMDGRCFQPEQLRELVETMLERGYSTDVVRGILGENFKRVYAAAAA